MTRQERIYGLKQQSMELSLIIKKIISIEPESRKSTSYRRTRRRPKTCQSWCRCSTARPAPYRARRSASSTTSSSTWWKLGLVSKQLIISLHFSLHTDVVLSSHEYQKITRIPLHVAEALSLLSFLLAVIIMS